MSTVSKMPTIAEYLSAHPDGDPKELRAVAEAALAAAIAETNRLKEENTWRAQEYRDATEVELDDDLNFKPKTMAQLQRLARMYAESGLVPDHYKNNVAGCAIGIQMALRMHVDILTFLQCSFVHKGKIGIEAKLAMARLNTSGKIKGRVSYKFIGAGDLRQCTASAVDSDTGEILEQTVTWEMVKGEGWDKDNGSQKSKWKTLTDLMFQYRAGIFLARVHYPDVLLGMYTIDELEDIARSNGDTGGAVGTTTGLEELSERFGAAPAAEKTPKPRRKTAGPAASVEPASSDFTAETPEPVKMSTENTQDDTAQASKPKKAAAEKTPAKAPAGPVGTSAKTAATATPPASSAAPKASKLTLDGLKNYMRIKFEDDWTAFDLDRIAKVAIEQNNPQGYCELILSRKNPNWSNFVVVGQPDENPAEDPGESPEAESQDSAGTEEVTQDAPECMMNPLPRPRTFVMPGTHIERTIMGYRQAKRIRDLMRAEIQNHPGLTNKEAAYLLDLGERRAWQLEQGTEYDELAKESQIPA